jgi:hypothetical protein
LWREQGKELWNDDRPAFAPLARLQRLSTIHHRGGGWQGRRTAAFDESEIVELERRRWLVTGIGRARREGQPLVEIKFTRIKPQLLDDKQRILRFLPERGWLFDGAESLSPGEDGHSIRTTSQMLYDFRPGAPARRLGANFEYYDVTAGRRVSTSRHRIVRRELDERAERSLQLSSYPLAPRPMMARLPVPLSVAITWAGAGLSLTLGLALKLWPRGNP